MAWLETSSFVMTAPTDVTHMSFNITPTFVFLLSAVPPLEVATATRLIVNAPTSIEMLQDYLCSILRMRRSREVMMQSG